MPSILVGTGQILVSVREVATTTVFETAAAGASVAGNDALRALLLAIFSSPTAPGTMDGADQQDSDASDETLALPGVEEGASVSPTPMLPVTFGRAPEKSHQRRHGP